MEGIIISRHLTAEQPPASKSQSAKKYALQGRKILIIVENLPVPFDRRVWQEARALHGAGATVSIICPNGRGYEAPYECLEGIHVYRHPLQEGAGFWGYIREYSSALFHEFRLAWKVFRRHGFDAIQGCNPPDLIFLVALPFKLLGRRFVFDHHDINPELYEAKFRRRGIFWHALRLVERLTFATADISIATNESYRSIAIARGGMSPKNVYVVRSGPDLTRVKIVQENDKWRNGRKFLVGYVGVMGEQEGIDILLDSMSELIRRGRTDIQLCLVGDGNSFADLKIQSKLNGLDNYVTFTGRVSDNDLFEILSTSDVCVNPDRANPMNDKSTMNKILEYMAMGKPIVQFDLTEGRVSAGEASLYALNNNSIDFADKIEELLSCPERREKMGKLGRTRVEKELSWEYEEPKLINAYRELFKL